MSEATATATARPARHTAHKEAPTMDQSPAAPLSVDELRAQIAAHIAAGTWVQPAPSGTVSLELNGVPYTLPRKYAGFHVCSALDAENLDEHSRRQFSNSFGMNLKNRAERYAAAKTDADRTANAPLSDAEILAAWMAYVPRPRTSTSDMTASEKMLFTARWSAMVQVVADHNKAAAAGGEPVLLNAYIRTADGQPALKDGRRIAAKAELPARPAKTKGMAEADHEAALETWEQTRRILAEKFASNDAYAGRIQAEMDRLLAEKAAKKAAPKAREEAAPVSVIAADMF